MTVEPWFPHRRPVPVRAQEGDAVVVSPGRAGNQAVRLNPTARALWELCDGATSIDEMVQAVCDLFTIDPERARTDVEAALQDLRVSGLIT